MIKKRLEHAVFLMGMLFITLLTSSANAFAEGPYSITVTDANNLTVSPTETDGTLANNAITLKVTNPDVNKLPAAKDDITITINDTAFTDFTYSAGVITLTSPTIDGNIVIIANAVPKSTDTTLSALTYKIGTQGSIDVPSFSATSIPDVNVSFTKESIVVTGTAAADGATVSGPVTLSFANNNEATATITVTAEKTTETKAYTVKFIMAKDQLASIAVTQPVQFTTTVEDDAAALAILNGAPATNLYQYTTDGGQSGTIGIVWSVTTPADFKAADGETNNYTWKIKDGELDKLNLTSGGDITGAFDVLNKAKVLSTIATLKSLTYTVEGSDLESVPNFTAAGTTYNKELPVTTVKTAKITIAAVATDAQATIVGDGDINLVNGAQSVTVTVTAEDKTTKQVVTINFTTAAEKVTAVIGVPPTFNLAKETETLTSELAIAQLEKITGVTLTSNSGAKLKLKWEYKTTSNTNKPFDATAGGINTFDWSVVKEDGTAIASDITAAGKTIVTNYKEAETGTSRDDIPVTTTNAQVGDGSTPTSSKTVTVGAAVQELLFYGAIVTESVAVPSGNTTTISLKGTNEIANITNAGTLTLKNATAATSTSSIATRAVANTGAVKAVVNNGTFTDETGTIVIVGGANNLEITTLPVDQLNVTAASATLTVASTTANAKFQWKKNGVNVANAKSTTLTVAKADYGSYTCIVTNDGGTATLVTPAVTVSFQGTTPPPVPEPTYYAVSLPAVTGAKFSKAEKTAVIEGGDFAFQITLDKDYNLSVPVVKTSRNNEVITAVAGVYTVSNVRGNLIVTVTGITKNIPTGIDDVNSGTRIWAAGSTLHIFTEATENVYVFNASGVLQKQFRTSGGDYTTQMNEGLYIVKIGNYTQKVIIK